MKQLLCYLNHPKIYLGAMLLMVISLPWSMFLISVAAITLVARWLLGRIIKRDLGSKLSIFLKNKAAVVLTTLYLLHLLGLLHTTDFHYAENDLRIKLPLLVLPVVFSTMPRISRKEFYLVLWVFIAANFVATINSYAVLMGWVKLSHEVHDIRDIVVFVSHIRFALFVCLSIFSLGYFAFKSKGTIRVVCIVLLLWFTVFLYVLGSPTGILVLTGGLIAILMYGLFTHTHPGIRLLSLVLIVGIPTTAIVYIQNVVKAYYDVEAIDFNNLEKFTPGGEAYYHVEHNHQIENGHYVWVYIATQELRKGWNNRSELPFDSLDLSGQQLRATLIRYLSSKGLRKDSLGMAALSNRDIANIETGMANYTYQHKHALQKRLDQIIFEFDVYFSGGNPSCNSITQKLEFWRTARTIIAHNFITGVGTGDVQQAFNDAYREMNSVLKDKVRFRAHNQYLTMFIAFGVLGFVWFLFTLVFPPLWLGKQHDYFYVMFFICAVLSFISEDTLETQAGLTFFSFFNCFFLFAYEKENPAS